MKNQRRGLRFFLIFLFLGLLGLRAHSRDFSRGVPSLAPRSVVPGGVTVQLFQWPWSEIARECELYLGPSGFRAVQISPPQEHILLPGHPWWERYQPVSYQIHSRSGTQEELVNMISRCRKAGVEIYADVVLNHMTGVGAGVGSAGSRFSEYSYPGLFNYTDFHHCGRNGNDNIVNYADLFEVQFCELVNLADLDSASEKVMNAQRDYLNRLIQFGIQGFRIDAAKHIPAQDLFQLINTLHTKPSIIHELILGEEGLKYSDYSGFGQVNVFEVPFLIGAAFRNQKFSYLPLIASGTNLGDTRLPESHSAVVFLENHDLQRLNSEMILSYQKDPELYLLAQVFLLAWPYGTPQIFSGYRFSHIGEGPPLSPSGYIGPVLSPKDDNKKRLSGSTACREPWLCEHRLPMIQRMTRFRIETESIHEPTQVWTDGRGRIAFGLGPLGMVLINISKSTWSAQVQTLMPEGQYCNILAADFEPWKAPCQKPEAFVRNQGFLNTQVPPHAALVILKDISLN